jgi:dephospho-CoA kinase
MITAIIGRAGTGKSTIARILSCSYDIYIEADQMVASAYKDESTKVWFKNHTILNKAIYNENIDKSLLVKILIESPLARRDLENYLYEIYLSPIINKCRSNNKSLLVDGVVPRLTKCFDQVITVEAMNHIRKENLIKRGVDINRIAEINELQKET